MMRNPPFQSFAVIGGMEGGWVDGWWLGFPAERPRFGMVAKSPIKSIFLDGAPEDDKEGL